MRGADDIPAEIATWITPRMRGVGFSSGPSSRLSDHPAYVGSRDIEGIQ